MIKNFTIAVAALIAAASLNATTGFVRAEAQDLSGGYAGPTQPGSATDQRQTTVTQETPSRIQRNRRNRSERAPTPPDPAVIRSEVEALLISGELNCQVAEAKQLGVNAEQQKVYETSCASGPGYILVASAPVQSYDCIELAAQADQARARDPNADVGMLCSIEANLDVMSVLRAYAQEAGVSCNVDQASLIGKSTEGSNVYEIGCAGAQGAWIEKTATSWTKTECLQVRAQGATCRFTTPEEEASSFKERLVGSQAANCDVQQVRLMGQNANGRFYEAKCAGADGVIARLDAQNAVQQIYPCATAQQIGGGCTLTPAPVAAPATNEQKP